MRAGADPHVLDDVLRTIGLQLPADYRELMLFSNGAEGFVGDNYLMIWPVEELPGWREICDEMPYIVFFGSNGAGEGYAYDLRESPPAIVNAPFLGMEEDTIRVMGRSVLEFLERLERAPLFP
jgi:hypothetical protein